MLKNVYGYGKQVEGEFYQVIDKVRNLLKEQGFGVLTEINVKETLKKKLNVDFDRYVILGACNPSSAYQVLQREKEIGLLLPCNVIVFEQQGNIFVSIVLPTKAMSIVENKELLSIALEIEDKLKKVVDNL